MLDNYETCSTSDDCLVNLKNNEHLAIGISREYAVYRTNILNTRMYCFDTYDNIDSFSISMWIRKNGLHENINGLVHRLLESGLLKKWTTSTYKLIRNNCDCVKSDDSNEVIPINLEHAVVAIAAYLGLTFLSYIAYRLEKLIYQKISSGNPTKTWRIAHLVIEGKRNFFLLKKRM